MDGSPSAARVINMSAGAIRAAPYSLKPNNEKIVCPVLRAMYNNGDIVPDERGNVTQAQLIEAARKLGMPDSIAKDTGGFKLPNGVNIFGMNTKNSHFTGADRPYHHKTSSGILNLGVDTVGSGAVQAKFDELWSYNSNGRIKAKELHKYVAACKAGKAGIILGGDKKVPDLQQPNAGLTLATFARDEGYTREDLHALFVQGNYPEWFQGAKVSLARILAKIVAVKFGF